MPVLNNLAQHLSRYNCAHSAPSRAMATHWM